MRPRQLIGKKTHNKNRYTIFSVFFKDDDADTGGKSDPNPDQKSGTELGAQGLEALRKERERAATAEKELLELRKKYGEITPEKITELQQKIEAQERKELEDQGRYDEALRVTNRRYQDEIEALRVRAEALQSSKDSLYIENEVTEAFFDQGGKAGQGREGLRKFAKLLLPSIRDSLAIADGEVIVISKDGTPRYNTETAKPFTLDDLMAECRKDERGIFFDASDKASGGGTSPNRGRPRSHESELMQRMEGMSSADKINLARQYGFGNGKK